MKRVTIKFLLIINFICLNENVFSQNIQWERALGGNHDDHGYSIVPDGLGNIYLAGSTNTVNNGDVDSTCFQPSSTFVQNPWLIKMDSVGNVLWSKCMGIDGTINKLKMINDHEFILIGSLCDIVPSCEMWIAIIDTMGNFGNLAYIYGGNTANDYGYDVCSSGFNHYYGLGSSELSVGHGDFDFYLVETDSVNYSEHLYGGSSYDGGEFIMRLKDGNYFLLGTTFSNDSDVHFNHGSGDVWAIKIDSIGNIIWEKTYGGSNWDAGFSAKEYSNGEIIISGWTESNDGDVSGNHGDIDGWVFKIDSIGNLLWQKCYGGSQTDVIYTMTTGINNTLILGASAGSNDSDVTGNHSALATTDFWVINIDTSGNILRSECYGGHQSEWLYDVKNISGKIFLAGTTESDDGDVTNYHFSAIYTEDAWALVLDSGFLINSTPDVSLNQSDLRLYPNAVRSFDELSIGHSSNKEKIISARIVDAFGNVVDEKDENMIAGNLGFKKHAAAGIYFLIIEGVSRRLYSGRIMLFE